MLRWRGITPSPYPLPLEGYRIHTSWLRMRGKGDSVSQGMIAEGAMQGLELGLGRFGDRRLEKGGRVCMPRWWRGRGRAFGDWAGRGRGRCSSRAFCATGR